MVNTPRFSDNVPDKTILIVEDEPDLRNALAEVLGGLGYHAEIAANGLEALDRLRWGLRPTFVLLDMQMGVMTGWDFRQEQLREPALAAIPVVAMTAGYWKKEDLGDFTARIEKPIDLDRLGSLLQQFA
jgi:CheY-like chemotaxis protein